MSQLVNLTAAQPTTIQIWGFHGTVVTRDVGAAVESIAANLTGDNHIIHIMSGTHGYCEGQVGAVATPAQRFADKDRALANPQTKDKKIATLAVHDFNTVDLASGGVDPVTSAMSKLNSTMRDLTTKPGTHTFLLAYCCSAGTK